MEVGTKHLCSQMHAHARVSMLLRGGADYITHNGRHNIIPIMLHIPHQLENSVDLLDIIHSIRDRCKRLHAMYVYAVRAREGKRLERGRIPHIDDMSSVSLNVVVEKNLAPYKYMSIKVHDVGVQDYKLRSERRRCMHVCMYACM